MLRITGSVSANLLGYFNVSVARAAAVPRRSEDQVLFDVGRRVAELRAEQAHLYSDPRRGLEL
jgi:hypothetical protein